MAVRGRRRRTLALVPLRDPGIGKSRLAHRLDTDQRRRLALAMVADVVSCLRASAVDEVVLVAAGEGAVEAARRLGVTHVRDAPHTRHLDDSLTAAAPRSNVDVLVVMADLPTLRPSEVDLVLAAPADVVVAPSRDEGTGGLLQRAGGPPVFAFGPGSSERHMNAGLRSGRPTRRLQVPGFAHDVDTWADLAALTRVPHVGAATAEVLDGVCVSSGDQISPEKSWSSTSSFTSAR